MEENRSFKDDRPEGHSSRGTFWLTMCSFLVLAAAGLTLVYYNVQQRDTIEKFSAQETGMSSTITQLQGQVDNTTAKMNELSAAQVTANEAATNAARSAARSAAGPSRAEADRLKQIQSDLGDQQKQLQATQDDVATTRSDLEGNLNATRDDLNSSIAKTHDELVLLEKRGERDYFEFDAAKSKKFQRTGPLNISLRRTDPKHANVDLTVLVNDREIDKKKVNLYEPVWIYETEDSQPMQVVVNKIDKNSVHGYISAPKYNPEDLVGTAPAPPLLKLPSTDSNDDNSNNP
jgi:hypothetical protein